MAPAFYVSYFFCECREPMKKKTRCNLKHSHVKAVSFINFFFLFLLCISTSYCTLDEIEVNDFFPLLISFKTMISVLVLAVAKTLNISISSNSIGITVIMCAPLLKCSNEKNLFFSCFFLLVIIFIHWTIDSVHMRPYTIKKRDPNSNERYHCIAFYCVCEWRDFHTRPNCINVSIRAQ